MLFLSIIGGYSSGTYEGEIVKILMMSRSAYLAVAVFITYKITTSKNPFAGSFCRLF